MASGVTYVPTLEACCFSLPFRVFGYRLSIGLWLRRTKDTVYQPRKDTNDSVDNYQYSYLPGKRNIRVLELHPGASSDPLQGALLDVSLDDPTVDFEALSYVWRVACSTGDFESTIDLGGRKCRLGANLTNSLYYLRHESSPRRLWIDAICIDQCCLEERSQQVALMAEVYAHATSVVIWLGLASARSQLGLEILFFLSNSDKRIGSDGAPWDYLDTAEVEMALEDILGRSYFSRLWVVQEAALATHTNMCVGSTSIQWSMAQTRKFLARIKLAELSPSWQASDHLRRIDFRPLCELLEQSLAADAKRNGTVEIPSLLDVVHSVRHKKVFDDRDRIYGVMSLGTPAEIASFVPNYSLSWEETYRRFYDLVVSQVFSDPEITVDELQVQGEAQGEATT
ncbi:hypothetical protein Daus18300_008406 [Diaporthe australafricana]|uniref:Heterokaryon incompatibility domain-containing protein n=1 Tax=Diaporthe australafricana TaxID=127596 RepID=A0ABR3WIG8_9PEZI